MSATAEHTLREALVNLLRPDQKWYYRAVEWLISPNHPREGRTVVIAIVYINLAILNPDMQIVLWDHYPGSHPVERMTNTIQEFLARLHSQFQDRSTRDVLEKFELTGESIIFHSAGRPQQVTTVGPSASVRSTPRGEQPVDPQVQVPEAITYRDVRRERSLAFREYAFVDRLNEAGVRSGTVILIDGQRYDILAETNGSITLDRALHRIPTTEETLREDQDGTIRIGRNRDEHAEENRRDPSQESGREGQGTQTQREGPSPGAIPWDYSQEGSEPWPRLPSTRPPREANEEGA